MDIPVPVVEESESEEETMKKVKQKDTIQTGLSDTAEVLCLFFSAMCTFFSFLLSLDTYMVTRGSQRWYPIRAK